MVTSTTRHIAGCEDALPSRTLVVPYRQFVALLNDARWIELQAAGAQVQRPLWASTSTKDPTFSPTRYVDELVAAQTVNTMPTAHA